MSKIAYMVKVKIYEEDLQEIINVINKGRIIYGLSTPPLTMEEVFSKPSLLEYLCEDFVWHDYVLADIPSYWNNDGWCDVEDFR